MFLVSPVCYCTPPLFSAPVRSLAAGWRSKGWFDTDSKEGGCSVTPDSRLHKRSALKSVDTRTRSERLTDPQPSVETNTSTISVCVHFSPPHSCPPAHAIRMNSGREASSSDNVRLISIRLDSRRIWCHCKDDSLTFHTIDAWVDRLHVLANGAVPLASVSDGPVSSQLSDAMEHCRGPLQTSVCVCVCTHV